MFYIYLYIERELSEIHCRVRKKTKQTYKLNNTCHITLFALVYKEKHFRCLMVISVCLLCY